MCRLGLSSLPPLLHRVSRTTLTMCSSPIQLRSNSTTLWPRRLSEVRCTVKTVETTDVVSVADALQPWKFKCKPHVLVSAFLCLAANRCSGRLQWDNICLWADILWQNTHNGGKIRFQLLLFFHWTKIQTKKTNTIFKILKFHSALFLLFHVIERGNCMTQI